MTSIASSGPTLALSIALLSSPLLMHILAQTYVRLTDLLIAICIAAGYDSCFSVHHDTGESVDARRMTAILSL